MMSPINFNAKRTGEPTALNLHGGFDEAGAGNITKIKIFVNAPALDPTSEAFSKQLINELMPEQSSALAYLASDVTKELRAQSFAPSSSSGLQDLLNQAFANYGYSALLSQEKNYQIALFTFFATGGLRTRIEDVTQDGRIDIVIEMRHCVHIIELKVNQNAADAIAQIKTKDYARKYRYLKVPIWAIGVNLAGKKPVKRGKPKQTNEVLEVVAEKLDFSR